MTAYNYNNSYIVLAIFWLVGFLYSTFLIANDSDTITPDNKVKALEYSLLETSSDSQRINIYNKISWELHRSNLEESYSYAVKAEALSREIGYKKGLARALNLQAIYFSFKNQKLRAKQLNEYGLEIATAIKDSYLLSVFYNDLGNYYLNDPSHIDSAYSFYHKALNYTIKSDTLGFVFTNGNLALLYLIIGEEDEAEFYNQTILEIANTSKNTFIKEKAHSNELSYLIQKKSFKEALDKSEYLKDLYKKQGDYHSLIYVHNQRGYIYELLDNNELQLREYKLIERIINERGFEDSRAINYYNQAFVYYNLGRYQQAEVLALNGLEINKAPTDEPLFHNLLSYIYKGQKKFERALESYVKYKATSDSIAFSDKTASIQELEFLYQTERKERENQLLKAQRIENIGQIRARNLFIFSLIGFLGFIFGILYLLIRQNQQRKLFNSQLENEIAIKTKHLQMANARLQNSNEELERFTYVAAHDLKTPLRSIISFSELLKRSLNGKMSHKEADYFNYIENGSKWMQELVDDLLIYSKYENGKAEIQTLSIQPLFDNLLLHFKELLQSGQAKIELDLQIESIQTDRIRFKQVIQNIVHNAIKYKKPHKKAHLKIRAFQNGNYWQFEFEDNGIGIEEEYTSKIFEPFAKLHPKDQYEGSGVGLSICKKIVDSLGGMIWVESIYGEGSTFFISLPKEIPQLVA